MSNKNKNKNPHYDQGQQFDIILSQQDYYQKVTKTKQLYQESLLKNKQLQQELKKQRQTTKVLKSQTEQLIKKLIIMAQKVILFEEENSRLQQQLQKCNSKRLKTIKTMQTQILKYKQSIDELTNQIALNKETYNKQLQQQTQTHLQQIHNLNKQLQQQLQSRQCESISVQNKRLIEENDKLTSQNKQNEQRVRVFLDTIVEKITKIVQLFQSKEQIQQHPKQEGKKDKTKTQEKHHQSIMMIKKDNNNDDNRSYFQFIELSLNRLMQKIKSHQQMPLNQIKWLKQTNKSLQTTNESLTKRLTAIQSRCQHLEYQLSSQLNVRKVIQTKYMGIRQVINNNEQVNKAMQDLINKYHEAIDNQYAKILQKIINQQQ